ncbi:integrase catalytic domain-containing protein [Trichonephila clavata]|uniref:Integrase catalytic domain-containing protein n=1 Tax=Trichonephila clavata TaxID=2740835 RepID=A0A8X6GJM8_TRICU|nr:integrase catalytic domain-containing protein [Trichonephila clavata]
MQSEWPSEIREKYKDTIQFYEEKGILKVQTRLILSQDPEDFTHPTVLPDHPLLERLVLHTHRSLMHAGVLTTLAQLREKILDSQGRRVLSASDHLIEDHHGTDIAAQNPGPTATDVLKEGKKSRWGRPLIPVKRLNL